MSPPLRVLVVDDSRLAGGVLTAILEADPDLCVVGVAHDGLEALDMVPQLKPDVITMDVWMPRMDGFATVERLMAYYPTPILVITTSLASQDVDISLRMLAAGALDVIEKPSRIDEATWERACRTLIQRVKTLARVRVVTHLKGRRPLSPPEAPAGGTLQPPIAGPPRPRFEPPPLTLRPPGDSVGAVTRDEEAMVRRLAGRRRGATEPLRNLPPHRPPGANHRYEWVGIASSTGGPQALLKILRDLPPDFTPPVLIVQHIAEGFAQGLAEWLAREAGRPVHLARAGERPLPGTALLAPDGMHLLLSPSGTVELSDGPPRDIRPCADLMMKSLAAAVADRAIGVILTGMGRDGADGLRSMRLAGAYTIAQDEATSIIFGMPRAAIHLGVIDEVLPLEAIAARLVAVVRN